MPSTFNRYMSRNIGTSNTTIGNFTVPASTQVTIIGLSVANIANTDISCSVGLFDGTNETAIVRSAPIPAGGTLVAVGSKQKIVLRTGDSIRIRSSDTSSADAIMSVLELT